MPTQNRTEQTDTQDSFVNQSPGEEDGYTCIVSFKIDL